MAQQNQIKNIDDIESKEEKDIDLPLEIPRLVRTYRASCPLVLFCRLGRTETTDPNMRNVWHPECNHRLHLVQGFWRQKVRLLRLQIINRVLMRKISNQIKPTDFIRMIYKFL